MKIEFVIDGVPVAKARPRFVRRNGNVHSYTPQKTLHYEEHVRFAAMQAMVGNAISAAPIRLTVTLQMPIPACWSKSKKLSAVHGTISPTKRPDIDNIIKAISDGCNSIVWHDDAQIVELVARKIYSDISLALVTVETISGTIAA
jgi:Holliday junction resolvase RusA-like endonuclease